VTGAGIDSRKVVPLSCSFRATYAALSLVAVSPAVTVVAGYRVRLTRFGWTFVRWISFASGLGLDLGERLLERVRYLGVGEFWGTSDPIVESHGAVSSALKLQHRVSM